MDEDWLDKFVANKLPVVLYTHKGTWYAGPILDRTAATLTLEVTAYKRTGMADPNKTFQISEIWEIHAAEYLCEICGGPIEGPHTQEECFK